MNKYNLTFDGVSDLFDRVHLNPSGPNKTHKHHIKFKSGEDDRERWMGGAVNWYGADVKTADIPPLIISGYKPGLETIQKVRESISPEIKPPVSIRRKRRRGPIGDELDIHRIYRGELDRAWSLTRKELGAARAGSGEKVILVDVGAVGSVRADSMKWRGAYAATLAENYAMAGFRVEVWGFSCADYVTVSGKPVDIAVKILSSDAPFNLETLANTVSFPGFFRAMIFQARLTVPERTNNNMGGSRYDRIPEQFKARPGVIVIQNLWSLDDIIRAEGVRQRKEELNNDE